MTTLSVIIPAYNQADFIDACLDSVANQTWDGDLEVIVVDDESPDDIGDRARAHDLAPRVIRQKNTGVAGARNRGIAESRGEWIAFLDADDRWTPDKLARQMSALQKAQRPALSFCRYRRFTPDGTMVAVNADHPEVDLDATPQKLMVRNFIGTSTVVVHRQCIDRCGGFPDTGMLKKCGQDLALWLRIAAYFPLVYVPFIGMRYTVHQNNRVGVDPVRHHRGGLEALRSFRNWAPERFKALAPAPLSGMVALRTGKFMLDSFTHKASFPKGSISRACRESLDVLTGR